MTDQMKKLQSFTMLLVGIWLISAPPVDSASLAEPTFLVPDVDDHTGADLNSQQSLSHAFLEQFCRELTPELCRDLEDLFSLTMVCMEAASMWGGDIPLMNVLGFGTKMLQQGFQNSPHNLQDSEHKIIP